MCSTGDRWYGGPQLFFWWTGAALASCGRYMEGRICLVCSGIRNQESAFLSVLSNLLGNPGRLLQFFCACLIMEGRTEHRLFCSATSFLRNWDSILEKKRANLRSISEPARLRQPPPRSTGAAHARGRAQSIREERRIAAPPVLFALLWVRLLPALYGPFCGPLRPFGGCPWGVTPPARECLPPAPPDTRRRG